ncbi:MAG: flagellar hook protein FlgE [Actinomycetota bacterium]|nr:flagellar hook protein FlgE [Actinomycetota bacterium]
MTERSVLAAVSGIQANQTYLDSIGNNIANADTVGYKASQIQFQDLLAEQISGASGPTAGSAGINPVAVGSGVRVAANEVNLQEGSLMQTGNPNDVAIQGNGYLVVQSGGQQLFTRDGSLTTDANGNLSTQTGGLIMGWQATANGTVNTNAPLSPIKIPQGETIGATATTTLDLGGNLPAWNGTGTAPVETTTYNAYDALGNVVPVTLTFTGVTGTANEWTVQGTVPNPSGGTASQLWSTAPTITFDPTTGGVKSITGVTANPDGSFSLKVGTMPTGYSFPTGDTWTLDFPSPSTANAVTQYAAASTIQINHQDGYASGTLQSYSIGSDGTITGSFSNGATLALGQIALANFANAGGLADQGGGLFATSPNSGQALIGTPGTGGRGALLGGELEQSNVNLGTELTNLITAQEAYTANTKTLTTSSTVIQALENVP